jgi:hypothetical protein
MISTRHSARLHGIEGATGVRQMRSRRRLSRRRIETLEDLVRPGALERVLKENSSALTFLGITLGVFISRRFFALPIAVAAMLVQDTLGSAGLARARRAVRG